MKIVQVVTQMEAGGAQKVALVLAAELRRRGHQAEVWFLYKKRACFEGEPGVRVLLEHRPGALDYLRIVRRFDALLREERPDAVITHTHYSNVLCLPVARLVGIPRRIAVQHNPFFSYPSLARLVDSVLGTGDTYSANVAVSDTVIQSAAGYSRRYRERLARIYNGVQLPELPATDSAEVRRRWGISPTRPLIVNVGRLAPQKNQAVLIEAMRYLPEASLVIFGEGELRGELEQRIRELDLSGRVTLAGERPWHEVLALLQAASAFAFPSIFESMGLAVVEAMGANVPVVASNIPAMREVVGDAGLLVESSDARAMAAALQRVLTEPGLADGLRARGLARSRQFSLESMVSAYEHLLH